MRRPGPADARRYPGITANRCRCPVGPPSLVCLSRLGRRVGGGLGAGNRNAHGRPSGSRSTEGRIGGLSFGIIGFEVDPREPLDHGELGEEGSAQRADGGSAQFRPYRQRLAALLCCRDHRARYRPQWNRCRHGWHWGWC